MKAKRVLIVSRRYTRKDKLINWVSEVYLQILAEAGIIPVIVPIAEATKLILSEYLDNYDGLLMVEGGDVGPHYYGEHYDISKLDEHDALKDEIEIACVSHALNANKPILGFCRGMHIINILFGGTLHFDVHEANNNSICHIDYAHYDTHRHQISIVPNTPLWDWYRQDTIQVNTYHHQGIKDLAPELVAMATAPDGLIEAVYHPAYNCVVGLQFHPERMLKDYMGNALVFKYFIDALK